MQTSFSNRPSMSTFIEEQRKHSAQQISKIQQSNHKLDQLEEKMKSLLQKDKLRNKSNLYPQRDQPYDEPNSDQINRYFESSKKHQYDFAHDFDNEDLLLDNHGFESQDSKGGNARHFSINQRESAISHSNIHQQRQERNPKRQKSTGSLKIFKRPTNKNQDSKAFGNKQSANNSNFNSKNSKFNSKTVSFGNYDSKKIEPTNSRQMSKFSSLNMDRHPKRQELSQLITANISNMIHPHSDIFEINQLQLMMQKSLQIKEKELTLAQEELKATEDLKVIEYRRNLDLQIHLENVKKYRSEITLMDKGSYLIKLPHTDPEMHILCEQMVREKTELQVAAEDLNKKLRELEDLEYTLKLEKKKHTYELGSLQREFQKVLKHHTKRMKQNIPQNHQKSVNNEDSTQRLLPKRHPSAKTFKTHKKHSSSAIEPRQSTQQKYEHYIEPQSINTKRSSKPVINRSKQKLQTISKSISVSGLHKRNRHALSGCQAQHMNCGTDKVLIDMVHELDKLKDIVNKEIVKTRSKKSERRVIELMR